jgi:REP element-mobilizing transposase RayT
MVLGYHAIISAYGFWLPNDPRGSWSDFVRSWELLRFGKATKVSTHHSVARRPHDRALRLRAKQALRYPAVSFTGVQARAVARGFGAFVERSGVTIWACSILPEHVHLVIGRHTYRVEQIMNLLKGDATRQLVQEELHPLAAWKTPEEGVPCCWGRRGWKVFLDSEDDILRAIRYVEDNPLKEGKRRQTWKCVMKYPAIATRSPSAPR